MKALYSHQELDITLTRLAHQLIENHLDFSNTVIIGLQPRGVFLSDRIHQKLQFLLPDIQIPYGKLDITFYRDDFNSPGLLHQAQETQLDFSVAGKNVILIDDVLYTGRSIRAGLDALLDFGRPQHIELLVLIDRRFSREVPIQSDYIGMSVDVIDNQKVRVLWQENDGKDEVVMIAPKKIAHK
ncbi:bifunctional pyr operon transcriptional regulator/uracil phosphoribosyltransferase PyrR [Taibaiella sp. KBW10]|uniref:bifunctional pyr operon transcriptional regulator/uracil phosphoribosyltransferase PyrR n=1 Tax=Taibaiella sp. KBW10 TaxID=2153357 RepID=UPI000F5973FA|nr:bifunctional pyr operon transcriptional regulator/uracil phosphoribosyltransferase PyrR [Taibaiella sp. KBW10]RQO32385.1 bifunctional pyr operon transcriptional regulator/uracil phosphoribosyltransferase PyrR [Taibaiella sp. KBW10]